MTAAEIIQRLLTGSLAYEDGLDLLTVGVADQVDAALESALTGQLERLVQGGWQPTELHRVVARRGDPLPAQLVAAAIVRYARRFGTIDPRWAQQAEALPQPSGQPDRIALIDARLTLCTHLRQLPRVEILIPPPGHTGPLGTGLDHRLLPRVRALLAKAEATDFPAEAEAYAAKAQELIARHSLAEVASPAPDQVLTGRRVAVDHPYEDEKAVLLDKVARANRCETVWSPDLAFTTVFGFDADLDAVELLYTSLLVQVGRAMVRAEPRSGKAKIKAFRRSFLIAYTQRVGERFEATTAQAVTDAGGDLLPVLASRQEKVQAAARRAFPETVRSRGSRVDSWEGWDSGRAAADEAALDNR